MATYDNLPVYKASYDLLVILFQYTKEFNREYKYTIGESIKKEIIEMMTSIFRANVASEGRRNYIQSARENIETVRLFMRILQDLRQINLKKFVQISEKVELVSKQLAGWQKASRPESRIATASAREPRSA